MIKFAPKKQKHIYISKKKEIIIFVYKNLLPLAGDFKLANINANVWKYLLHFHKYYKGIDSFSRTRSVCVFTGRTRGLYRGFQFSRMKIRDLVKEGSFVGISKSSW